MKATVLIFLLLIFTGTKSGSFMQSTPHSYLALGDSYTIGESVPHHENFPNQVVQFLRRSGHDSHAPEIIAKTGWTTDELNEAIDNLNFRTSYDFVSLLIGVNNQYRGRSAEEYKTEFELLLKRAISFAGNNVNHVVVLSIPDWGITPFAEGRDRDQIAREIDTFNEINKKVSSQYKVQYIDITNWTREAVTDPSLLATDGLHPSSREYKRWAEKISEWMKGKKE
jgi:lysophospholipase L1-like esterase